MSANILEVIDILAARVKLFDLKNMANDGPAGLPGLLKGLDESWDIHDQIGYLRSREELLILVSRSSGPEAIPNLLAGLEDRLFQVGIRVPRASADFMPGYRAAAAVNDGAEYNVVQEQAAGSKPAATAYRKLK